MGKLIKITAYLIMALVVLIMGGGLLYQLYLAIHGITLLLSSPCPFEPPELAAMAFIFSSLLLMGSSAPRRWQDTPDVSPGEMARQIRSGVKGFLIRFRRSLETPETPVKQRKRRHSEIL